MSEAPTREAGTAKAPGGFHPGHNPFAIALTVTLATFMEVLDTSIANVALPHIAGDLAASEDQSTWVLTSYLVSNAVILPLGAWISRRIGRKRFYMICGALFTGSSFLCGIAPSLGWLIFFRVLQGAGGGGLAPSEQSILADTFEPKMRGAAFAIYGMAVVVAPAIGPTLGGYITDHASWRWIFFLNVPVGALSLFLTHRMVTDPPYLVLARKKKGLPVDFIGLGLVVTAFGALQIALDKGQEDDWLGSHFIVWLLICSATSLVCLVIWELRTKHPVIDLRLLANRNFALCNLLLAMVGAVLFSSTVLLPQFEQTLLGYSASSAGMSLSPAGVFIMVLMPIVGFLVSRVASRWLVAFGFVVTALGLAHMTNLDLGISFGTAVLWRTFQMAGLAFLFVPINTAAFVGLPPNKNDEASGILNLSRNIGGSVGISLVTTLLARRSQLHQSILVKDLTALNPAFRQTADRLSAALEHAGSGAADAARLAQAAIYGMVQRQAVVLAYVDIFAILSFAAWCMVPVALLLRRSDPRQESAHE